MKNYLKIVIGVVFLILLGIVSAFVVWNWFGNPAPAAVLNVNSVFSDPGAYQGEITLQGVVADLSAATATFLLIDIREYRSCGQLSCASKFVRVHYSGGELPALKSEVLITGEMIPSGQGYLMQAKTIKVLQP